MNEVAHIVEAILALVMVTIVCPIGLALIERDKKSRRAPPPYSKRRW